MSHLPPCYPEAQTSDPRFAFVEKAEPGIVDSRLSGFTDKEGLMDSRILSSRQDSRQNMIAFSDSKEHVLVNSQEPRYVEFCGRNQIIEATICDQRMASYQQDSKNAESLLDAPLGYDSSYSLAGQTVPITLKHQSPSVSAIQPQFMYQNFGTIHSGILRVSEPGTSSSSNSSQRSMTLQNPKRKSQLAQNTFSTLECEKRRSRGPGGMAGKPGFYAGSAVWPPPPPSTPR